MNGEFKLALEVQIFVLHYVVLLVHEIHQMKEEEEPAMKGYSTDNGFMGYVEGRYILFASESDYYDYMEA